MQNKALVLLGHGSRSKDAIEEFNFIVDSTQEKSDDFKVFGAHMEIAKPSLEEVIDEINNLNMNTVVVMPYFLFNGNHIKFDIPKQIKALQLLYPNLKIVFGSPIAREPMMAELMLNKSIALSKKIIE